MQTERASDLTALQKYLFLTYMTVFGRVKSLDLLHIFILKKKNYISSHIS